MTVNKSNKMSLMSKDFLDSFVETYVERKECYLRAVKKYGSPLYILETDVLVQKAKQFKEAFVTRLPKVRCYFAMKSNNLPLITKILVEEGFGIDVSSGIELSRALSNGACDIIFSGPGKTEEELKLAMKYSSKVTILLDSIGEIERIKRLLKTGNDRVKVGVRLNNNPSGLWRKFGIPLDQLQMCYREIKAVPNLEFKGLQCHSSWNLEPDRQIEFIKILGACLRSMPMDFLDSIEFIDIGGGYWPQQGEWLVGDNSLEHYHLPAHSIDDFANKLALALKSNILNQTECAICLEPGRWICNDSMHILCVVFLIGA